MSLVKTLAAVVMIASTLLIGVMLTETYSYYLNRVGEVHE